MGAAVGLHGARLRSSLPWQRCSFVLTPFSRCTTLGRHLAPQLALGGCRTGTTPGHFLKPLAPGTAWMVPVSLLEPERVTVSALPT